MELIPHSDKQQRAILSKNKILALLTGIQFGKTTVGAVRMQQKMFEFGSSEDAFLITAPTYKILQQSTLPAFLNLMRGYGEYSKADAVFRRHGGGICYMRTSTDPDSVVGVTNVRHVWLDEAGKAPLYFWENLQARAAYRSATIDLTSSPYTLNWIFKEIVRPKMKDPTARPDVDLIQASSEENPYFPRETIARARATMDARRFNMMFGGEWSRMQGLVYDCFSEGENICAPISLPTHTRYFGGIDWGFTEPFAMVIHGISPNGRRYQVSETYESGLTIIDIAEICRQRRSIYNVERFYCDPSQPGYIEELNRRGIPAVPAINDIRPGIDKVYELLKTREMKFFNDACKFTIDELEGYHYPEPSELSIDQTSKEQKPVGQNDHLMDAVRYVTVMTNNNAKIYVPKTPGEKKPEDQMQRLKRLKKRIGYGQHTENWSD